MQNEFSTHLGTFCQLIIFYLFPNTKVPILGHRANNNYMINLGTSINTNTVIKRLKINS